MRLRVCAFLSALLLVPSAINSQQTPTASTPPSASALLAQSLAALIGSVQVTDVTLMLFS
jgi:hypothetical protein